MTNVTDVLLVIFDYVARYTANHIDQRELTSSHSRNQTLAACARVCRSWSAPALAVLYRDIALGQVVRTCSTDGARSSLVDEERGASAPPGEDRGPDQPPPRRLDHGHHRQADRPRVGFTGPALQRLVQTLHSFHRAGSQIPARIRSLHLGIGCLTPSGRPGISFVTHSAPHDVARLIALCPQLQHLSIVNGHPFIDQPNQPLVFEHEDLAVLEASIARQTLRTVCLNNAKPVGLLEAFPHLDHPLPTAAFQLLRIFAPSITATRLDINVRYADFIGSPAVFDLPLMPNLTRAVVLGRIPEDVQEVLNHAPGLRRLLFVQHHQTKDTRVLRAPALEQLVVRHLYDRLDMSALHALRSLRVICSGVTKNLVQTVRLAPAGVQDLWIDMFTNTLDPLSFDNWFDERVSARHLSLALQQRTSVRRLITVQGQTTQQPAWHSGIGIPISTNPNRGWYGDLIQRFYLRGPEPDDAARLIRLDPPPRNTSEVRSHSNNHRGTSTSGAGALRRARSAHSMIAAFASGVTTPSTTSAPTAPLFTFALVPNLGDNERVPVLPLPTIPTSSSVTTPSSCCARETVTTPPSCCARTAANSSFSTTNASKPPTHPFHSSQSSNPVHRASNPH